MGLVKISVFVDEKAWKDLQGLAHESQKSTSTVVTEAIRAYLLHCRRRPSAHDHLEESIEENEGLGNLLAE